MGCNWRDCQRTVGNCLLWGGPVHSTTGLPQARVGAVLVFPQREAWMDTFGVPLFTGRQLRSLCSTRLCVQPYHRVIANPKAVMVEDLLRSKRELDLLVRQLRALQKKENDPRVRWEGPWASLRADPKVMASWARTNEVPLLAALSAYGWLARRAMRTGRIIPPNAGPQPLGDSSETIEAITRKIEGSET